MNLSKKHQLKNYLRIFVLLIGVSTLLWNCEKEEEPVLLEQSNSKIKVYSYEKQEVTQITSIIERAGKKDPFIKNKSSKVTEPYWIDEENIFGVIDSVGNKTFVYRLYFNKMPENTFYNIIVSERVDNEISPMVIAYEMDGEEKKSMKYYELESFLNSLIQINNQAKNKGYAASGDDIIDITDCGELTNPSSSNTSSSGYGGSNNNNSDGNSYTVQNYNTYVSFGSYNVYSWGSPGGGGSRVTIEVGIGSFEYIANALKENAKKGDDDDRVICPEGELIIIVNNVVIIINELTGKAKCVYELLKDQNGNLFLSTIGKFIDNSNYHLQLNSEGSCGIGEDACTDGSNIDSGLAIINIINEGRGTLDLAALILHEAIHAEIYKYVHEYNQGIDPQNRENLLGYYFQYQNINIGTAQHQHMADKFVKPIAEAIRALDNNRYPLEDYMGFGWDGLRKYGWDGYYDNGVWTNLDRSESSAYYKTQKKVLDNTDFNKDCNE